MWPYALGGVEPLPSLSNSAENITEADLQEDEQTCWPAKLAR